MNVYVGRVPILEIGKTGVKQSLIATQFFRQGITYKITDSMTYHCTTLLHSMEGKMPEFQGLVNSISEVFERIYQGSVKVKDDGFVSEI